LHANLYVSGDLQHYKIVFYLRDLTYDPTARDDLVALGQTAN
jgi:hypothetical protein